MNCFRLANRIVRIKRIEPLLAALLLMGALAPTTTRASRPTIIAKWGLFEAEFKSKVAYPDPVRDAALTAVFVSPAGVTNHVDGFWDGGQVWRVRFSPTLPGRWTFTTACSDKSNRGLENQTGEFTCTAPSDKTALDRRGPLRVADDRRHFEHADGRPFLWLGDWAPEGARRSSLGDWKLYADIRRQQRFTASHWIVAPGRDARGEPAFTTTNGLAINAAFFQRLDAKVDVLNRAGLLSAIVPLQEFGPATGLLSDEDVTLFLKYVVARWGAHHVAWLLAFEGDSVGKNVKRWKRIGRAVFGGRAHAPVILLPGETQWLLDEFRDEAWVDAFGFPATTGGDDALQWMFAGPLSVEWQKSPPRPILNLTPTAETSPDGDDARRLLWWNALLTPTAGASYAALPVMNWITNATTNPNMRPKDLPQWREALFLPGARSVAAVAEVLGPMEFWRLRPAPQVVSNQPGRESPRRHVAAAQTETRDLTLVYVPEERAVEVWNSQLPSQPVITWINPRTGQRSQAGGRIGGNTGEFPTPEPGDWLLQLKTRN